MSLNVDCRWFSLFSYVNFDLLDWFFVYIQFISQVNQVFISFGIALSRMEIKYGSVNAAFILELRLFYSLCLLQWLSPPCCQLFSNKWSMTSTVHGKNKMCDSCFVWSHWIGICSAVEQEVLQESSSVVQVVYKISCNGSGRMGSSSSPFHDLSLAKEGRSFWKLNNSL